MRDMKDKRIKLINTLELEQMSLIFSWTQMLDKFKFSDKLLVTVLANSALEIENGVDILANLN